MVKGTEQTAVSGPSLYYGFVEIQKVLAINPDAETRAKLNGYDFDAEKAKEIEYLGETDSGSKKVDLLFYLQGHVEGMRPIVYKITLEDKVQTFTKEDSDVIKYKWINQVGQTFVGPDEASLPSWFVNFQSWDKDQEAFVPTGSKKTYRKGLVGEDKLIEFVRECLNKVNQNDPNAEVGVNIKDLFKGKTKELLSDLQSSYFRPFVGLLHVTTNKDGDKHYQNLYIGSNTFNVPSLPYDSFKMLKATGELSGKWAKRWAKYKEDADGKYGATGFKRYVEATLYDETQDFTASEEVAVEADEEEEVETGTKY